MATTGYLKIAPEEKYSKSTLTFFSRIHISLLFDTKYSILKFRSPLGEFSSQTSWQTRCFSSDTTSFPCCLVYHWGTNHWGLSHGNLCTTSLLYESRHSCLSRRHYPDLWWKMRSHDDNWENHQPCLGEDQNIHYFNCLQTEILGL